MMTRSHSCSVCGSTIAPTKRADAAYCSQPCRSRALWARRSALLAHAREIHPA